VTVNQKRSSIGLLITLVLALLSGAVLSVYYLWHMWVPSGDSLCGISEAINCQASSQSMFARVGPLPVALLGAAFYLGGLVLVRRARPNDVEVGHLRLLHTLFGVSVLYSLFLAVISAVVLKTLCPVCTLMYVANGVGLFATWKMVGEPPWTSAARVFTSPLQALKQGGVWFALFFAALCFLGIAAERRIAGPTDLVIEPREPTAAPIPYAELTATHVPGIGPVSAPLVVVEFSDFQCPYCARLTASLHTMREVFGDQMRLEFRNLPLEMHEMARPAALAALCAHQEGKFWELHDLLFENQAELTTDVILALGTQVGLNEATLQTCMNSEETRLMLEADRHAAEAFGVQGTPTFFINGVRYAGGYPPAPMERLFRSILEQQTPE
jgi:protein-disulfide isomerase